MGSVPDPPSHCPQPRQQGMNLVPSMWIVGTRGATPWEAAGFAAVKLLAKAGGANKPRKVGALLPSTTSLNIKND
jgi:hypothetical protein